MPEGFTRGNIVKQETDSSVTRVVNLALKHSRQTLVPPMFESIGTICGGLFPKMYRGHICNLELFFFLPQKNSQPSLLRTERVEKDPPISK